ncbi:MAG TPA: DUF4159 domain-containing protein [Phycisphaerae bacterium]|nr:DUF4159 domain-containing protein [Phycisphaerae bacterium]
MLIRNLAVWTLLIAVVLLCTPLNADDFVNPKAAVPPQAHKVRMSGGESVPPLPLPATPIRRSEHHRDPAPPALIGMLNLDVIDNHQVVNYPTETIDIETLMNWTNAQLGLDYRYVQVSPTTFSYSPTELPVLYITGWTPLPDFSQDLLAKLRGYVMAGGTILINSSCGRPEFNQSAMQLAQELFPDHPLAVLPLDDPMFHCLNDVNTMRVRQNSDPWKTIPPYLEAVYIGCRAGLIFSPVDMSWGWDADQRPIQGGTLYAQQDSLELGANILTYVLANFQYARAFQIQKIYQQQKIPTRDQLVIGQVVNNGDWNPTPHGLPNLLKFIDQQTTLSVQFKRDEVSLDNLSAGAYPVLYMTGLRNFAFSPQEITNLRNYLHAGGMLLVDDAMGAGAFDSAFRQQIKLVLPDQDLKLVDINSPLYHDVYDMSTVTYSPVVQSTTSDLHTPVLEAIFIDGAPAVIYSRISLSNGWEDLPNPYAKSYSTDDSLKLGTNILIYALTH